jgi:hypothetical protein
VKDDLLATAARSLAAAVGRAARARVLDRPLPADSMPSGAPPTVREAANGAAYDLAFVPHTLGGRALDDDPPAERGADLLGDDPDSALEALAERAVAAVRAHEDPTSTTHLSYGDLPARDYVRDITGYYGLLAVDVDAVTGHEPPHELVEGLWEHLQPFAEQWREWGVLGPRVEVAEDAPLLDRLRGLTGRRP